MKKIEEIMCFIGKQKNRPCKMKEQKSLKLKLAFTN